MARTPNRKLLVWLAAAAALLFVLYFIPRAGREEVQKESESASSGSKVPDESVPEVDREPNRPDESKPDLSTESVVADPVVDASASLGEVSSQPAAESASHASTAVQGALIVLGTVTDAHDRPIRGAYLRWFPASLDKLEHVNNDLFVLGPEGNQGRASLEDLDRILDLSLSVRSGAAGAYRLQIPDRKPYGSLSVWAPGSEIGLKPVVPAPRRPDSPAFAQVDFRLRQAGEIRGRVTERESGRPAPGMVVQATILDSELSYLRVLSGDKGANAIVREDGAYAIAGLPAGVYQVTVDSGSTEYAPLPFNKAGNVTVESGQVSEGADFEVEVGGRLKALVLGPEEKPLARAECRVIAGSLMAAAGGHYTFSGTDGRLMDGLRLSQGKSGSTGSDGRCILGGLPLGQSYSVGVSYSDFAPAVSEDVSLSREHPEAEVEVRLEHAAVLSGQAVFDDGRPAAGIHLRMKPQHPIFLWGRVRADWNQPTDSEGRFRFENLSPGAYDLTVFGIDSGSAALQTFELDAGQVMEGVRFVVPSGAVTLVGTISNHRSQPVFNAALQVSSKAGSRTAQSQEDGSFRIEGLEPGSLAISVSHPGFAQLWQQFDNLEPGEKHVQLVLEPNGWIVGRVVGPEGEPIRSGGKVSILSETDPGYRWSGLSSAPNPLDEEGGFRVEAAAGSYVVQADVAGYAPSRSEPVQVEAAQTTSGVVIQVGEGAAVAGIVVLSESGPVEGASILLRKTDQPQSFSAFRESTAPKSGPDGRFRIPNQAPGEYSIAATHDEYIDSEPLELVLEEGRTAEVTLTLSSGGGVSGTVVDGDRPMGNINLSLAGRDFRKTVVSQEDGSFRMLGVPPDLYVLMVGMGYGVMDDFPDFDVRILTVTVPPAEVVEIEVDYSLGIRLHGQVRNLPAGLTYPQVTLRRPGGPAPEDVVFGDRQSQFRNMLYVAGMGWIGRDGSYQIRGVPPGRYILELPRQIRLVDGKPSQDPQDRVPFYRTEIVVSTTDLRHDIVIP